MILPVRWPEADHRADQAKLQHRFRLGKEVRSDVYRLLNSDSESLPYNESRQLLSITVTVTLSAFFTSSESPNLSS